MQSFSTIRLKSGATDHVGKSAERLQRVIRQLEDGLHSHDYTRLITPLIEEVGGREQIRMDFTTSVARALSERGREQYKKVFYSGSVFQPEEKFQVGFEERGDIDEKKAISLAVELVEELTGKKVTLSIGDAGLIEQLLAAHVKDHHLREQVTEMLRQRNVIELKRVAKQLGDPLLGKLPILFGREGAELILPHVDEERLNQVIALADDLQADLDFGQMGLQNYYDGVTVHGFIDGVPEPVLIGGRYDRLYEQFGQEQRAFGIGFSVERLAEVL
ncbi:ATP phosphoribosyltransferase regulatory subunit [Exiguobacterium flavidum]|uniref:ATP phosphoribosyltransferase regulatory subunit n=1 Tax=Exiguobacterium flavidum TaxID=2184695 RepID=UPI000DF7D3E7|nr:ATP phosphoribosyltransferase regulatory subunit [Exiguobacterium flavidum]